MSSDSKTVMAAHELRRSILAPFLIFGTLAGGCSQAPAPAQPQAAPPQSPPPSVEPKLEAKAPLREDRVVVIDPGEAEARSEVSLVEVAREEKERRSQAAKPMAVITNRTLPAYAAKGQLTVATPGAQPSSPDETGENSELRDERYWRSRGLEIRRRWREAVDEIGRLEQNAAGLRRRFYAEADPYRRDGQIKPEWDRVLDHLEQKRTEAELAEKELEEFMEAGRQAGALPGWLHEGAEEEPPHKDPQPSPTEAIEPREFGEELPELGEGPP